MRAADARARGDDSPTADAAASSCMSCLTEAEEVDLLAQADVVKGHHERLRLSARRLGAAGAWAANVEDAVALAAYAQAMQSLGEGWARSGKGDDRVDWIVSIIVAYYRGFSHTEDHDAVPRPAKRTRQAAASRPAVEGASVGTPLLVQQLLKDARRAYQQAHEATMPEDTAQAAVASLSAAHLPAKERPLEVLDVGSCYNPVGKHPEASCWTVTPVDLCPAADSGVLRCDFTRVHFGESTTVRQQDSEGSEFGGPPPAAAIDLLGRCAFDAVVFCLLLSYLPCPRQRFTCVANAFRALRPQGLLVIVTTKTVGKKDLKWLQQWHAAAASLGFKRVAQDVRAKLICLAYRRDSDALEPPDVHPRLQVMPIGADAGAGAEEG